MTRTANHDPRSGARSVARKLALQALYRLQINDGPWQDVLAEFQSAEDMPKADFTRWVAPEALADVIVFLLSAQARAIWQSLGAWERLADALAAGSIGDTGRRSCGCKFTFLC